MTIIKHGYCRYLMCECGTYTYPWTKPDVCVVCGRENSTRPIIARMVIEYVSFWEWLHGKRERTYYEQANPPLLTDREKLEKYVEIVDETCKEIHRSRFNCDCGIDGMCDACKIKTAFYERISSL